MKIDKKSVGQYITLIRKTLGLTMEEFGKKVNNASKGIVSNWENGVSLPNNERLIIIAKLGNIDVQDLLNQKDIRLLESGKLLFNTCLAKHSPDTVIGKALRYFDKDEQIKIINLSMERVKKSPVYVNNSNEIQKNIEIADYKNIFYIHMLTSFEDEYVNRVKTNWNILSKSQNHIRNFQYEIEQYNYTKRNKSLQFSISDTKTADISYYETGISSELLSDINNILEETTMKLKKLFDKYPDDGSKKGIGISITQYDVDSENNLLGPPESFKIANIIDGIDTLDSPDIPIDESIKEKIIEIAKTNEHLNQNDFITNPENK